MPPLRNNRGPRDPAKNQIDVLIFAFWLPEICFKRKDFLLEEKCSCGEEVLLKSD